MKINVPPFLSKIAERSACPIYIVGGYIRNCLLNMPQSDIDICGRLLPEQLGIDAKIVPVNKRLGTALICGEGESYEYTPFRTESYGEGGEHSPREARFGVTIDRDVRRRDFTAGSVYYDIKADEFVDPLGGLKDIRARILRSADPDFTLADDGLRLMRLARIAAETGFEIERATFDAAIRNREKLADISAERKRAELEKILTADLKYGIKGAHYRGVELLKELKLWEFIIKEVADMDGVEQNPLYHKYDCLEHSLRAVGYAHPSVRLAALLHDVAKPVCMKRDGNTYMHNIEGALMVRDILGENGLKYPNKTINFVSDLVKFHMYDMGGKTKLNKLKIFLAEHAYLMPELVYLIEADGMATGYKEQTDCPHRFTSVYNELLASGAPMKITDLIISGTEVEEAGFAGSMIKDVLTEFWHDCIINPAHNNEAWLREKLTKLKRKYKV